MPKSTITIVVLVGLLLSAPVLAATTSDFVADGNITISAVTFGVTTADVTIISGSRAQSWSFSSGTFTVTNPDNSYSFKVSSADTAVKSIQVKDSGATPVACTKNTTPGTSYVVFPSTADTYTLYLDTTNLTGALTYNAYCGAATCESGYSLSGSNAAAICVANEGGGGGGGGGSNTATSTYQTYNPLTGETITGETAAPTSGETGTTGSGTDANYSDPALVKATIEKETSMVTEVDEVLTARLKGNILLQVEEHGEGWYVSPKDAKKYYLGRPADAYNIMRFLSVGITDANMTRLQSDDAFAKKHSGKIFIQVEQRGEAWYVDFDGNATYMKDGAAAYDILRSEGLGITNDNIRKIPVGDTATIAAVLGLKITGE